MMNKRVIVSLFTVTSCLAIETSPTFTLSIVLAHLCQLFQDEIGWFDSFPTDGDKAIPMPFIFLSSSSLTCFLFAVSRCIDLFCCFFCCMLSFSLFVTRGKKKKIHPLVYLESVISLWMLVLFCC